MQPYVVLHKEVGQTPLACAEVWRASNPEYADTPLAYAGRLDPMASGKLLILIGEECKKQTDYHGLDKQYEFSVLIGIGSDTGDVLGRLTSEQSVPQVTKEMLQKLATKLSGDISLPYPHFSSKTVQGKPLHTWTLEGRLDEIEIPLANSNVYSLECDAIKTMSREALVKTALDKIETIPPVTEARKAIGNDFRRADVRADWQAIGTSSTVPDTYMIASFTCVASSGTYMRSLAELIARELSTIGLAWHIHRTHIGKYDEKTKRWQKTYP